MLGPSWRRLTPRPDATAKRKSGNRFGVLMPAHGPSATSSRPKHVNRFGGTPVADPCRRFRPRWRGSTEWLSESQGSRSCGSVGPEHHTDADRLPQIWLPSLAQPVLAIFRAVMFDGILKCAARTLAQSAAL